MKDEIDQLRALAREEHETAHRAASSAGCTDAFPSTGRLDPGGAYLVPEEAIKQLSGYVTQLGRIVAVQQRRLDDMEKGSTQRVTASHAQVLSLQKQIRHRAVEICDQYELMLSGADPAAVRKAIKRDLLDRWGIRDLHDLPLACLDAARERIARFMSIVLIKERREAAERIYAQGSASTSRNQH